MKNFIYRNHLSREGRMLTTKIQVKAFTYADTMYKFLNKQSNNKWSQVGSHFPFTGITKAGYYAIAGGKYHNCKELRARGINI